jgi:hypothetical protein
MNNYPQSIAELDLDAVIITPEILAAVKRFAASKPYRGSTEERIEKFRTAINDICHAAGVEPPSVNFSIDETQGSGGSFYSPATKQIFLNGTMSIITLLHELRHHLPHGESEHVACAWSLRLFRDCFPGSWGRLSFNGHMAVKPGRDK